MLGVSYSFVLGEIKAIRFSYAGFHQSLSRNQKRIALRSSENQTDGVVTRCFHSAYDSAAYDPGTTNVIGLFLRFCLRVRQSNFVFNRS